MHKLKIQQVFGMAWEAFCLRFQPSPEQSKAAYALIRCKSGALGYHLSICDDCGYMVSHANSCRNRNCPNCQAVLKEVWIDKRRAEVIDTPYFHVVFTIPAQLNALVYANQKLLYGLMHSCSAHTLLELAADPKYLGARPGIIQVLHTWGQKLNYHPHIHCIVSGGGLSKERKLRKSGNKFFLPFGVLARKFRGMFLANLQSFYQKGQLRVPKDGRNYRNSYVFRELLDSLYSMEWHPYIKETFNGFGNAIEYLGRYTHRIAITNARIRQVTDTNVIFTAHNYKTGVQELVPLTHLEFIRRFLMHVLPSGFQKIRYYGFLNNRSKRENLKILFRIQGHQRFRERYTGMTVAELLKAAWDYDLRICPKCGCSSMRPMGWMLPKLE